MTRIADLDWDVEPMELLQMAYENHMTELYSEIRDVDELGMEWDGCMTCDVRATLAFLIPRVIDLYDQSHIRRLQHTHKEDT